MSESNNQTMRNTTFSPADLAVLAHLYRGEVYRSTVWRTRLDATTNWAVVATGLALSLTFSSPHSVRQIGFGWATWSHGYAGNVFYTNGSTSITMTMSTGAASYS